jgi:hypothetical protein
VPEAAADSVTIKNLLAQRIVTRRDLSTFFRVCDRTISVWARKGQLPPPLRCSGRNPRWDFSQVCLWVGINTGGPENAA